MKIIDNPEKYAQMSKPFNSRIEAEKALEAFYQGVTKLREKHRIAEAVCIAQVYFETDGEKFERTTLSTYGDILRNIEMLSAAQMRATLKALNHPGEIITEKEAGD